MHCREIEKTLEAFKGAGAAQKLADNGATLEHIKVSVRVNIKMCQFEPDTCLFHGEQCRRKTNAVIFGACPFQEATREFVKAADKFMHDIENDEELKENPIKQRMVNDKLMQIEKVNFAPKLLQIEATSCMSV